MNGTSLVNLAGHRRTFNKVHSLLLIPNTPYNLRQIVEWSEYAVNSCVKKTQKTVTLKLLASMSCCPFTTLALPSHPSYLFIKIHFLPENAAAIESFPPPLLFISAVGCGDVLRALRPLQPGCIFLWQGFEHRCV